MDECGHNRLTSSSQAISSSFLDMNDEYCIILNLVGYKVKVVMYMIFPFHQSSRNESEEYYSSCLMSTEEPIIWLLSDVIAFRMHGKRHTDTSNYCMHVIFCNIAWSILVFAMLTIIWNMRHWCDLNACFCHRTSTFPFDCRRRRVSKTRHGIWWDVRISIASNNRQNAL